MKSLISFVCYFSAWVEEDNIKDYAEYKEKFTISIKARALKEAVAHIEDYIQRKEVWSIFKQRIELFYLNFFFLRKLQKNPDAILEEDNDIVEGPTEVSEDEDDEYDFDSDVEVQTKKTPKVCFS